MRSLSSIIFTLLILGISSTSAQLSTPGRFALRLAAQDTSLSEGLLSNIVAEIRPVGDSLTWFGTGRGLAMHDGKSVYSHRTTLDSLADGQVTKMLPLGGIPAVAVMNDTMAVAYSGDNGSIQVGYGLTLTYNAQSVKDSAGISWVYLSQPMDADADTLRPFGEGFFRSLPVTVPEANVTYDAFLYRDYLWTASWAGGLRRFHLDNQNWEVIPMPMDQQDSLSFCSGFEETDDLGRNILPGYYLTQEILQMAATIITRHFQYLLMVTQYGQELQTE